MTADATVLHVLHPGDVAVAGRGERLETVLGSCVAILLTDRLRTVGAMCHVVHARPPLRPVECPTAHGDDALAAMFTLLRRRAIEPRLCRAWVYGGGHMFPGHIGLDPAAGHVGANNARWALQALQQEGIAVQATELGGHAWRRLAWTVGPGEPELQVMPVPDPGEQP
jgi:chemotaxis protein CheD